MRSRSPARRSRVITALAVRGRARRLDGPGVRRRHPKRRRQCRRHPRRRRRAAPLPGRASAGAAAGRGPAAPDDPEEKIGQMTQAERAAVDADPSLVAQWHLGSVLSGGGSVPTPNTPAAWVEMVEHASRRRRCATRLQIPIIYGVDAVHGHGNLRGATVFPHNVGLGSTRDPALVERIGHATATEVRATGIPWNFAPCLCVSRDERWGRSYESFGEDPALVLRMGTSIDGLQGPTGRLDDDDRVLATAKHYAGDGDTDYDTAIAEATRPALVGAAVPDRPGRDRHQPCRLRAASTSRRTSTPCTATTSAASCPRSPAWTGPRTAWATRSKMHAHRELITDALKRPDRVRRIRHLRLGGHPPDPGSGRAGQRRAHRVQGARRGQRRAPTCSWSRTPPSSSRSCCWPR